MSCLEISDLTKSYDKKTILNNINLTIDSGKIVGLLGENGAGKSTLMKCIVGLVKIDSGEINFKFKGKNKLGFLIEYPAFYPNLSAFDNLKIFASLLDIKNERISEVIKEVGLYKYTDVIFDNYSLGMKQRLGLARAILANPDLLILDEPFNGLDPSGIIEIRNLLKKLTCSGKSILVSSHNLPEIEKIADEIDLLYDKRIVESFNMSDIQQMNKLIVKSNNPKEIKQMLEKYKLNYFYKIYEQTLVIQGEVINSERILDLIYKNKFRISEIYFQRTSLEEHFEEMVGAKIGKIK